MYQPTAPEMEDALAGKGKKTATLFMSTLYFYFIGIQFPPGLGIGRTAVKQMIILADCLVRDTK